MHSETVKKANTTLQSRTHSRKALGFVW